MPDLSPEILLSAYAQGIFPMSDGRHASRIRWLSPDPRAILPLDSFHVPRRLARLARQKPYEITFDTSFETVVRACADIPRAHEKGTWINDAIQQGYQNLHMLGYAHSVECWRGGALVGGLYGVQIGGAFFGESMFSRAPNASKLALLALVDHLRARGFALLDTQFVNTHLLQFGVVEISREQYIEQLEHSILLDRCF